MSIDIGASLIVGLPFNEIEVFDDVDDIMEYFYDLGLDCVSPQFDCDQSACVIGVHVAGEDYTYEEITDLTDKVMSAKEKFHEITGLEAKVYVSPNVW